MYGRAAHRLMAGTTSKDLVHWEDFGLGPTAIHETYAGMDSNSSPCYGFATIEDGQVCAGFRQCESSRGVRWRRRRRRQPRVGRAA
jgi:hypothetical protein